MRTIILKNLKDAKPSKLKIRCEDIKIYQNLTMIYNNRLVWIL